jgi:hypothetical protein
MSTEKKNTFTVVTGLFTILSGIMAVIVWIWPNKDDERKEQYPVNVNGILPSSDSFRSNITSIIEKIEPPLLKGEKEVSGTVEPIKSQLTSYLNIPDNASEVSILVLDEHGEQMYELSSEIAKLIKQNGKTGSVNFFKPNFGKTSFCKMLAAADNTIISEIKSHSAIESIIIGTYTRSFRQGERTRYICDARLNLKVISVSDINLKSFTVNASNGFDDEMHAEKGAIEKIFDDIELNHFKEFL